MYQYKDHLGNTRLAYQDINHDGSIDNTTEIKEKNHYYPFGLKHQGYNNQIVGKDHPYGFNGMEEATAFGNNMLEMDMRHYDAAIARWIVIDPVTHHDFSPYQAFDNNPVFWADPSGADSMDSQTDIFGRNRYDENGLYIRPGERGDIENNTNSFNSQEKISKTTLYDSGDFIYDSEKDGDSYAFKKAYHEYKIAILKVKILLSDSKKEKKMYQKRLMTEIGIWNDNRAAKLGAKPEGWETALDLISLGNWSKVKFVGKGLWGTEHYGICSKT